MPEHTDSSTPFPTAQQHAEMAEHLLAKSSSAPMDALRTQFATQAAAHASLAIYYQGSST